METVYIINLLGHHAVIQGVTQSPITEGMEASEQR